MHSLNFIYISLQKIPTKIAAEIIKVVFVWHHLTCLMLVPSLIPFPDWLALLILILYSLTSCLISG